MNNLSNRDKNLLLILVIVIIGVIYYLYIFTPQSEKISTLSQQSIEKENQVTQYMSRIENIENFKEKLKIEKKNIIPLAEKFYSDSVNQEDMIVSLNDIANQSGVALTSISFNQPEESGIDIHSTQSQETSTGEGVDFAPPPEENSDTNQTQETSSDEPNVKLLEADINILGTYSKIHEFIRLIERLDKNIVIDEASFRKSSDISSDMSYAQILAEVGDPNDYVDASMQLKIYNVSSLEDYQDGSFSSILTDPVIQIRNENSPFVSYPWGDWWTYVGSVSDYARGIGYVPGQIVSESNPISINVKNPIVQTKKPSEITDFNDIASLKPITENSANSITVQMEEISQLPYKVATTMVEFSENSSLEDKVILDFSVLNRVIDKKPSEIGMILYSDTPNAMEAGIVFSDSNSVVHYLPVVKNINNVGKTDAKVQFDSNVSFPIRVTGVYVKRNNPEDMLKAKIALDMLYANYITFK